MSRQGEKRYTSDLTPRQWEQIKPLIPPARPGGRPRTVNIREVLNGIFYRLKNACSWENLPKDFSPSPDRVSLLQTMEPRGNNRKNTRRLASTSQSKGR